MHYITSRWKTSWNGVIKNYLYLNVSKRKRCVLILGRIKDAPNQFKGVAVGRVDTYKYLGVVFGSKLNWKENINSVLKKVNLRMYCMRKLRSFGVNSDMLVTFYNAVICSIIMFGSVCWGASGNISKLDRGWKGLWKKQVMLWKSHWTVLRFHIKRDCTES